MARIAPDSNDIIVHTLNGDPGTRINTGTSGATDNWTDYGAPVSGAQGFLDIGGNSNALYIPSSYIIGTVRNGTGGSNDTIISPHVSLSGWVFLRRYTNFFAEIFHKQYFLNGWSTPFLTFGFQLTSANNGELDLYITTGGVLQTQLRTPNEYFFPVGRWCHLGGTWNGTTMNMYINGSLAVSGNYSGTIDYGTASRGQWCVGGIPGSSTNQEAPVIVQDVRIANVARPQSYFANIYYNGFST